MAGPYIPLSDLDPNQAPPHQSHNDADDSVPLNHTTANKAPKKTCYFGIDFKLFCKTIVRCIATIMFLAWLIITFSVYEKKGNFSKNQKVIFQAIITAESLCVGLNFFDSFKDLANASRGKILKRYKDQVRMRPTLKNLIIGSESLIKVARLGWEARSIPMLCFACMLWILFNLVAQTSVAVIGLTYELNDGTDWKDTYLRSGTVNAANLSCYFHPLNRDCPSEEDIVQGLANSYGYAVPNIRNGTYTQIDEVVKSTENYGYFCRNPPRECTYRMVEYNPDDQERIYPAFTNRTITASAGECFTYWETEPPTEATDTSGNLDAWEFKISNGSVHDSIIIPRQHAGIDATTYIYRGVSTPPKTTKFSCGNRCIWMWAHKNEGKGENSTFYQCPVTISTVSNAKTDTQKVPDSIARLAASSIALQGRWAVNGSSSERIWTQFRFYPYGDDMELHHHNAAKAGENMVLFAIRSLSTLAYRNPSVQVPSLVPYLGSRLDMKWNFLLGLCSGIVVVQFLLSIFIYLSYVEHSKTDEAGSAGI